MGTARTLADGRAARTATVGDLPGFELLVPDAVSEEPSRGSICRRSDGREFTGLDAFKAGSGATSDPFQLAVLAMLVLEPGVAGKAPFTAQTPETGPVPGAQPPALNADGLLVYWRRHQQLANWVRVHVDLRTGTVEAVRDNQVQPPGEDLVTRATAQLAASTLPERQGAVIHLSASDDPAAIALLIRAATANEAWTIRQQAARQLGERPRVGAVAALLLLLTTDTQAEVRAAAATALGKLGRTDALGSSGAEVREKLAAATVDPSEAVRAAANGALAQLR